jgi:hypothetical protein
MKLHAAVLFLTLRRRAAGDGITVAHPYGLEARGVHARLREDLLHLVGAALGEFEIRLVVADRVRMPFDPDREFGAFGQGAGELPQDGHRWGRGAVAVAAEADLRGYDFLVGEIDLDRAGTTASPGSSHPSPAATRAAGLRMHGLPFPLLAPAAVDGGAGGGRRRFARRCRAGGLSPPVLGVRADGRLDLLVDFVGLDGWNRSGLEKGKKPGQDRDQKGKKASHHGEIVREKAPQVKFWI